MGGVILPRDIFVRCFEKDGAFPCFRISHFHRAMCAAGFFPSPMYPSFAKELMRMWIFSFDRPTFSRWSLPPSWLSTTACRFSPFHTFHTYQILLFFFLRLLLTETSIHFL